MDASIPFYLSYAGLWILVILHSLILLGVVRMTDQLQRSGVAPDSPVGREAPEFRAVDLFGAPFSSEDLSGQVKALLFVSPSCPSCTATLYEMRALSHKANGNVIVICRAGHEECAQLAERHELSVPTVADEDERISRLFGISSVPMAVLIDENNRIRSYGYPDRVERQEETPGQAPTADIRG